MVISWYGYSCFKIEMQGQAGKVALVTDPFGDEDGHKLPRNFAADIVTVSHDHARHNNVGAVSGDPFVIRGPGEYEIKDVSVTGIHAYHDQSAGKKMGGNTLYYIVTEDIHLAHLGDLKHKLDESQMADVHNIDVLFVPVGGGDVLDARQAAEIIGQFEPRVIIPMHYRAGKFGKDLAEVEPFLKAMGISKPEVMPKLKLTEKELPQEEIKVIVLEPQ